MLPIEIQNLVDRFNQNRESYSASIYKEDQLRQEFLNPFFETLGWDVSNKQSYAEAYKEVIHEDVLKVGTATKAPDYSFRVGGTRKFFAEAKKPFVNIKDDSSPSFQLRRYAWSGKLPLSILTNFEEFAVYDCRIKPKNTDKASVGRILYLRYEEYEKRWDEIAAIFSKESVLKGSFDKFAETSRGKKGTSEVDDEFLGEIERWRDLLARNIAIKNPNLSQRELNFAVQRTIDRVIFLRICEDRGIEHYGTLMALLNGDSVYKRMRHNFQRADEIYNSGLFHFRDEKGRAEPPDTLTLSLNIDDKPLKDIIKNLYYPESPYEFSVLPADILGQVYEQFLGKVIRLTAGHQARVDDKPEVKKAGGVFYTPTYIVDYIVKNTVGKLIEGKAPKQIEKLKILDPACGSGTFLIQAYQFILDYHRDYYIRDGIEKYSKGKEPKLVLIRSGEWRLSTSERKKILLNNIHGVDIDSQAVEVTKLSLLLKVLEGENEQTLAQQMTLWHERALPDLENNIKCGNSLIWSDFYDGLQETMSLYEDEDEERLKINAFDWDDKHGFPWIMKIGGFDAVIGNPPYGAEFKENEIRFLKQKYSTFSSRGESYLLFIEKAHHLLRDQGRFGFIIPDTYLNLEFTQPLRSFLLNNSKISEIVVLPSNIFENATVDTTILLTIKKQSAATFHLSDVNIKIFPKKEAITCVENPMREFKANTALWANQCSFNTSSNDSEMRIISKIDSIGTNMSDFADMYSGVKVYEVGKGSPPQTEEIRDSKPFTSNKMANKNWLPFYDGKHIGRYQDFWERNNWLNYGPWLAAPREPEHFIGDKILIRKIVGPTLIATYSPETSYCNTLLFILKLKTTPSFSYKFLLGILNSRFIGWYYRKKFQISVDDTFPQIMIRDILQFIIPKPNKTLHDKMATFVNLMLDLHKKLSLAKTDHEKNLLQRQIDYTDKKIDELVYELYGLTEEEICIIEDA